MREERNLDRIAGDSSSARPDSPCSADRVAQLAAAMVSVDVDAEAVAGFDVLLGCCTNGMPAGVASLDKSSNFGTVVGDARTIYLPCNGLSV